MKRNKNVERADEIVMLEVDGEELLRCPFCGGVAVIWQCGQNRPDPNDESDDGKIYNVECIVCGMTNGGYFHKPKEALQAWNRRGR